MPQARKGLTVADNAGKATEATEVLRQRAMLKTGALQNAILTSAKTGVGVAEVLEAIVRDIIASRTTRRSL